MKLVYRRVFIFFRKILIPSGDNSRSKKKYFILGHIDCKMPVFIKSFKSYMYLILPIKFCQQSDNKTILYHQQ